MSSVCVLDPPTMLGEIKDINNKPRGWNALPREVQNNILRLYIIEAVNESQRVCVHDSRS
jgi:hypothetical protein